MNARTIVRRAVDQPDVALATIGCVSSIPLALYLHITLGDLVYTVAPVILLASCLGYLGLGRRSSVIAAARAEGSTRMRLMLNISFFSLLSYSIVAFYLRQELHTRPMGYFVALAAMAAILAVETLFLPPRRGAIHFMLIKVMILGLSLPWSQLLIYPSIVGVDPWAHQAFTLSILHNGHIPAAHAYTNLPAFHVLIGETSLVTGLGYKISTMLSVSLLQVVCNTLFVFLVGKSVHSERAGLLAALALVVAGLHIESGSWIIPNGMAVVFIVPIIYVLSCLRQDTPKTSIFLAVLLGAGLLFTHTISIAMLAVLLFSVWLGFVAHRKLGYGVVERGTVFLAGAAALVGVGLVSWAIGSTHIILDLTRLIEAVRGALLALFLPSSVSPPAAPAPIEAAVGQYRYAAVPASEHLFNRSGLFLFYGLAITGALVMLSRRVRNKCGFALITGSLVTLAISFFIVAPFRGDLTNRFNHLLQLLLALPVGMTLLWLGTVPLRRICGACLIGLAAFALSFLMAVSPEANHDNRTFSPNTIVRYGFTQSELDAVQMVAAVWGGSIDADPVYTYLRHLPEVGGRMAPISKQLYSRDFTASQSRLILIREEIVRYPLRLLPFATFHPVFRLDYDPRHTLTEQGFSRIYDNGATSAFLR